MWFWAPFLKIKHVGRHFACVFREFAHIFGDFVKVFRDFAQISTHFARILRDFVRIFTKSKLLRVRLNPLHPRLLHQCHNSPYRLQKLSHNKYIQLKFQKSR